MHEFFNVKNEHGCAADADICVHGSNGISRAHGHSCGGNALYALLAVSLDDFKRTFHSGIINADEEGGVAVQKKAARGRDLRDLEALRCQPGVDEMSIVIVNNRNNKFHKNPRPCELQRFPFLSVFESI